MDCIFCNITKGAIPADILHRDDDVMAFKDINPKAPVHILIIPIKHIETVLDLSDEDNALIGKMVMVANQLAEKEGIDENGFRLVFNCREHGGQEVYHLHLHLMGGRSFRWPPG
ncbi:histidine triad nucleotide-binding protein [candidate division LCP-89 bacterium B3_LCP]|uniref:Histidine triad nucleotide-binding protein n=1 Tax=candidate division LCP-89 bacterium B3_LCP TaxID=2012998 RepID=A0A532V4A9_UNCL8|nr:MAG: histidine triad nucleotide-binding protein [candidate division LCP-89 bacterium B3_LCP]